MKTITIEFEQDSPRDLGMRFAAKNYNTDRGTNLTPEEFALMKFAELFDQWAADESADYKKRGVELYNSLSDQAKDAIRTQLGLSRDY